MKTIRATVMTLCLATAFGLTSAGGPSSAQTACPAVISIVGISGSNSYSPSNCQVSQGTSLRWKNNHTTSHTATKSGTFDTGNLSPGQTSTPQTLPVGTHNYVCSLHPNFMNGTVTVTGSSSPTPPPTTSTPPPPPTTSTPPPPPPPSGGTTPKASPKATATQTQSGTSPQASPADAASPQESPTAEASLSPSTSPSITGSPARTPEAQGRSDSGLPPGLIGLVVIVLLGLSGGGVVWWMSRRGW